MPDTARLNQNVVSFASLRFIVQCVGTSLGGRFYGFSSFQMGDETRERTPAYGQSRSRAPIAFPSGKYVPGEPKIKWLQHSAAADEGSGFESFMSMLKAAAPDGRSYGNVEMYWQLHVTEGGIYTLYEWEGVYVKGKTGNFEENAEGLFEEWAYQYLRHRVNGGTLYDSSEED